MLFQSNLKKEKEDEKTLDKKGIVIIDIYDVKTVLKDSKKLLCL